MKSSKDINLDTYNLSLITAKEDVLNPRTSTNWALFAYDGVTNQLKLADSGVGGLSHLTHKLHPRRPLYGLCRVDQPKTSHSHIAMIIWVGKDVDDYRRAQCAAHVPAIKSFFKEVHFFLPASSLEDITEERIFLVASKVSEIMERERTRRVLRHEDRQDSVGTNYKRTVAEAELRKTRRENFWAQAEREEEMRKEEERRRALEDRRRRERERVLQEKREAEERDRRMNEKLQKIQEQRRLQALAEAEKHKQEQLEWAQQQRKFDDEMRLRFSHSESVEKAAEAAALVSQRKRNPREFFRQLSQSSITHSPPRSPRTDRSSNRKMHRSLTDAFISITSTSSSPASPCSPHPLSPFFPSSPTSQSPTMFSLNTDTQPQQTYSPPAAVPASIPPSTATLHPWLVSASTPSGHTVIPSSPSTAVPPSLPSGQPLGSPLYPSGQAVSFPSSLTGPTVLPSAPVWPALVSSSSTTGQTMMPLSPPSHQIRVSPSPVYLQSFPPATTQRSLTEIVECLVFYPPPESSANFNIPNSDQLSSQPQDMCNSVTQDSDSILDPSKQATFPTILSALPVSKAPSRPLPALPVSSPEVVGSKGQEGEREGDNGEKREIDKEEIWIKEKAESSREKMVEEEEQKEERTEHVLESWITAQCSMISIPEEEESVRVEKDGEINQGENMEVMEAEKVKIDAEKERDVGHKVEEEKLGNKEKEFESLVTLQASIISIPKEEWVGEEMREDARDEKTEDMESHINVERLSEKSKKDVEARERDEADNKDEEKMGHMMSLVAPLASTSIAKEQRVDGEAREEKARDKKEEENEGQMDAERLREEKEKDVEAAHEEEREAKESDDGNEEQEQKEAKQGEIKTHCGERKGVSDKVKEISAREEGKEEERPNKEETKLDWKERETKIEDEAKNLEREEDEGEIEGKYQQTEVERSMEKEHEKERNLHLVTDRRENMMESDKCVERGDTAVVEVLKNRGESEEVESVRFTEDGKSKRESIVHGLLGNVKEEGRLSEGMEMMEENEEGDRKKGENKSQPESSQFKERNMKEEKLAEHEEMENVEEPVEKPSDEPGDHSEGMETMGEKEGVGKKGGENESQQIAVKERNMTAEKLAVPEEMENVEEPGEQSEETRLMEEKEVRDGKKEGEDESQQMALKERNMTAEKLAVPEEMENVEERDDESPKEPGNQSEGMETLEENVEGDGKKEGENESPQMAIKERNMTAEKLAEPEEMQKVKPGEQNDKITTDTAEFVAKVSTQESQPGGPASTCGHSQTVQQSEEGTNPQDEKLTPAGNTKTNENVSNGDDVATEATDLGPTFSDHHKDSSAEALAETMAAEILEHLTTSTGPSMTVFIEQCPRSLPSLAKNCPDLDDVHFSCSSSVDEAHEPVSETEEACEDIQEKEEDGESESSEEDSEMDEQDYEPAQWHTAELITCPVSANVSEKSGPEDVSNELEDKDFLTSTDSNQLTWSAELDPLKATSDVEDGQEALTRSTNDETKYEDAQEPEYDSDSVEEATEQAFLPANDVNVKVMDTVTMIDSDIIIKSK